MALCTLFVVPVFNPRRRLSLDLQLPDGADGEDGLHDAGMISKRSNADGGSRIDLKRSIEDGGWSVQ